MCQVLKLQRSSYYKWRTGAWARQARQQADDRLVARIQDHHHHWDRTLGYRRMTVELNAEVPAASWESPSRWAGSAQVLITPWRNRSTPP